MIHHHTFGEEYQRNNLRATIDAKVRRLRDQRNAAALLQLDIERDRATLLEKFGALDTEADAKAKAQAAADAKAAKELEAEEAAKLKAEADAKAKAQKKRQ